MIIPIPRYLNFPWAGISQNDFAQWLKMMATSILHWNGESNFNIQYQNAANEHGSVLCYFDSFETFWNSSVNHSDT